MSLRSRQVALGAIFLLISLAGTRDLQAHEESKRAVAGQLVDAESGQPIPYVRVTVKGAEGSDVMTDEDGKFSLSLPVQDSVRVVVDDPLVAPVVVQVHPEDLTLVISTTYATSGILEVTVRGAPQRTATSSEVTVSAREIEAVPIRNAEDALRLVPGITLVQHGSEGKGHQFFLRGFDAVHGMDFEVTLEGIPLNEWSNVHGQGYIDLGFIIPETISQVHVVKGPFLDRQGAFAMAGSAEYRLGIGAEEQGMRATYEVGTTNRHRAVTTYSAPGSDGQDFIALEALHDDAYGQQRSMNRGAMLSKVTLANGRWGRVSALGSGYLAQFELPGAVRNDDVESGRIGFYDSYDHAGDGLSGRGLVALKFDSERGDHRLSTTGFVGYRSLELLENYTGFYFDQANGDRRLQEQSGLTFGVSMEDTVGLSSALSLHFGASVRADDFEQTQLDMDQEENPIGAQRSLDALQVLSSTFGSLTVAPLPQVQLTAGGRFDAVQVQARDQLVPSGSSSGTLFNFSPRITTEWRVLSPWTLFASYGRGFRPPEARAFSSYEPGETGISEELYDGGEASITRSDAVELGTRVDALRRLTFNASSFATFISNEAVFDHVSGVNLELNRTRRLGVELDVRFDPLNWLSFVAHTTYVDARFVDSGSPIPFAPWLTGGVKMVLTHESGWRAGLRYTGMAPRHLPHGATGAPMSLVDATLGYHWPHVHLDLAVENLFNQHVREGEYHYASNWNEGAPASQIPVIHTIAGPPLNARLGMTVVF